MTRYTVVWLQSEEDRLAEIWLNSHDRPEVSAASHAIDVQLSADPSRKGMPIVENVRLLVAPRSQSFSRFWRTTCSSACCE